MSIRYLCLYGNQNNQVCIKREQLERLPAIVVDHKGGVEHVKLEIKKNSLVKYRNSKGAIKKMKNIGSLGEIQGMDISTKDRRYYFDIKENQKLQVRSLKNGNIEVTI